MSTALPAFKENTTPMLAFSGTMISIILLTFPALLAYEKGRDWYKKKRGLVWCAPAFSFIQYSRSRRIDTATNVDNENPPVRDDELDHNHDEPVNEDTSIQCDSCDAFGIDSTNMSGESACEICTEEVEQQHETEVAPIVSKIRNPLKVVESFVAEVQTPGNFELKEEPKPKPVKSAPPRLQPEISDNRILEPSRCGPCSRRPSNVCPYAIQRPATAEQPKCRPPPRRNCTPNSQQTSNDNSKNLWKWW